MFSASKTVETMILAGSGPEPTWRPVSSVVCAALVEKPILIVSSLDYVF